MTKTEIDAILRRIEIRMAELGMSKEEFYEMSGISSASYSQWNTGAHKPTKKKLADAAKTLKVSLEYLLTGEEDEKKPAPISENELTPYILDVVRVMEKVDANKQKQLREIIINAYKLMGE